MLVSIADMAHPPRIPIHLPLDRTVGYFVTICVQDRKPVLANRQTLAALRMAISKLQQWQVQFAVLMPDHLHLIASPLERDLPVGNFAGAIKRWMRQELKAGWQWQPGSFDHLLRSDESAQQKWLYVRDNPVRAGLANVWSDWPYRIECDSL
jgi:putative transposase